MYLVVGICMCKTYFNSKLSSNFITVFASAASTVLPYLLLFLRRRDQLHLSAPSRLSVWRLHLRGRHDWHSCERLLWVQTQGGEASGQQERSLQAGEGVGGKAVHAVPAEWGGEGSGQAGSAEEGSSGAREAKREWGRQELSGPGDSESELRLSIVNHMSTCADNTC